MGRQGCGRDLFVGFWMVGGMPECGRTQRLRQAGVVSKLEMATARSSEVKLPYLRDLERGLTGTVSPGRMNFLGGNLRQAGATGIDDGAMNVRMRCRDLVCRDMCC